MRASPHRFTLRQLQYVLAVAEELSFRRAAERCGVSQPSLSGQLAQVEDALGVRLFERGQKRVLVTVAGRDLVGRARRLLQLADELEQAAEQACDPFAGTARLGILMTISPYLLPSITTPIHRAFPRLRIEWVEERTLALVRMLEEGRLEGALVALESELGDAKRIPLATDPFFLVTDRRHPLAASNAPVGAEELHGQELLLLEDGHCFRDQVLEVCRSASAREGEFRATSFLTLAQMVAGSGGATLLPALALEAEAKRAHLHVRRLALPGAERTIGLAWRKGSAMERVLCAVGDVIKEAYPAPAIVRSAAEVSRREGGRRPSPEGSRTAGRTRG
jgi:LysR family hydrogen peroxide-inducible transcriptional activator